jgi:LacI family transcriptional regulator
MPSGFHPYYTALLEGYLSAARSHGVSVKLVASPRWQLDVDDGFLERHGFRGFITARAKASDLRAALERDIPVVSLSGAYRSVPAPRVLVNGRLGLGLALSHLRDLGHKRIAFVHPSPREGVKDAAAEVFDCRPGEAPVAEVVAGGWTAEAAAKAFAAWRALRPRPSAIFVTDDFLLKELLAVLDREGVRAPEDVAVMGSGTPLSAGFLAAPVSLVETDAEAVGRAAVDLLVEQMEGSCPPGKTVRIDPQLVIRESCGAPGRS